MNKEADRQPRRERPFLPKGMEVEDTFGREEMLKALEEDTSRELDGVRADITELRADIIASADLSAGEKKELAQEAKEIASNAETERGSLGGAIRELLLRIQERREVKKGAKEEQRARVSIEKRLDAILSKAAIKGHKGWTDSDFWTPRRIGHDVSAEIVQYREQIETLWQRYVKERARFAELPLATTGDIVTFESHWNELAEKLNATLEAVATHLEAGSDEREVVAENQLRYADISSYGTSHIPHAEVVRLLEQRQSMRDYTAFVQTLLAKDEWSGYLNYIDWDNPKAKQIPDDLKRAAAEKAIQHSFQFLYQYPDVFLPHVQGIVVHGFRAEDILRDRLVHTSLSPKAYGRATTSPDYTPYDREQADQLRAVLGYPGLDMAAYAEGLKQGYDNELRRWGKKKISDQKKKSFYAEQFLEIAVQNFPAYFRQQKIFEQELGISAEDIKRQYRASPRRLSIRDAAACKDFLSPEEMEKFSEHAFDDGKELMPMSDIQEILRTLPLGRGVVMDFLRKQTASHFESGKVISYRQRRWEANFLSRWAEKLASPKEVLDAWEMELSREGIQKYLAEVPDDKLLDCAPLPDLARYVERARLIAVAQKFVPEEIMAEEFFTTAEKVMIAKNLRMDQIYDKRDEFPPEVLKGILAAKSDIELADFSYRSPLAFVRLAEHLDHARLLSLAEAPYDIRWNDIRWILDASDIFSSEEMRAILDSKTDSQLGDAKIDTLAQYLPPERLVYVAKLKLLSETIGQIALFSSDEIKDIVIARADVGDNSVPLAALMPYLDHRQLVAAATKRPLSEEVFLGDTFTRDEKIAIASKRTPDNFWTQSQAILREMQDDILSIFIGEHAEKDHQHAGMVPGSHEGWQTMLSGFFSGERGWSKRYDLSAGPTKENILFALSMYAQAPDEEDASESLKLLLHRLAQDVTSEAGKKLGLMEIKALRDRVLNAPEDVDRSLSQWDRAAITHIGNGESPHLRVIEQTARFTNHLRNADRDLGLPYGKEVREEQALLHQKFQSKKIRYSDADTATYYEQYLAVAGAERYKQLELVRLWNGLAEDKALYHQYQNEVVSLAAALYSLSRSGTVDPDVAKPLPNILKSGHTRIIENPDPSLQREQVRLLGQEVRDIVRKSVERALGLRLPDVTAEQIDALVPYLTYQGHIAHPDRRKKGLIGFFAALKVSGTWDQFKRGEDADVTPYLTDDLQHSAASYLKERQKLDVFSQKHEAGSPLHIPEESSSKWFRALASPSEAVLVGEARGVLDSMHRVDALTDDLLDPDNFQEGEERDLWQLVSEFGAKKVGASLAKRFRDAAYRDDVIDSGSFSHLSHVAPEKEHLPVWQKLAKSFGQIAGFAEQTKQAELHAKIAHVDSMLVPSEEIIAIFKKIGEEMTSESGVIPLTEDVEYLESLLHKKEKELSPEEFGAAQSYLQTIKEQITELYRSRDELQKAFENVVRASAQTGGTSERFAARLTAFGAVFQKAATRDIAYKSTMTGDIADAIQHIRQCLGCKTSEINNDTNLTFGDRNRFLVIGRRAGDPETQSRSDELVTVQRTVEDKKESFSFVMDNVYDDRARDILTANVSAVVKKMREMRRIAPATALDVFVTHTALSSCNVDEAYLAERLKKEFRGLTVRPATREVHIAQSPSGDGHYEIGGGFSGRVSSGSGTVQGVVVEWG